ncbi:hypothetical protein DEJ30_09140 [Curtobacterium sp. MCPF17_003]|uniref:hypothetical protein n=1 Tax=Curtobacterium sp. MCPF17_003 TaxID=2175637 RepID=UPI000D9A4ECC|nr:hypothetical protein [Curtobacterium sp. MCPF17_003]PYY64239.1 hypothetical protein DEJ30_09140 [Curtobacterium sp. MCPF17_003]
MIISRPTDIHASAPSGDAVAARVGTATVELKGWHHKQWKQPDPNGLYRVITTHRRYEGNREEISAMPDATTWGHLTPVEYQLHTTPGYQWGDHPEDDVPSRPNEFVMTYVGLYELVGYSFNSYEGVITGQFKRVEGDA